MRHNSSIYGFSLIEVMVALAILAMGVSTLLIVRNNAIQDAFKSSHLRKITILLQQKMGELAIGLEKSGGGNFSEEGYRLYHWQASTRTQTINQNVDGKGFTVKLREVTVTVRDKENKFSRTLTAHFFVENPEDAEEEKAKSKTE